MENFIRNENLRLYHKALHESSDQEQRRVLLNLVRLLLEEQAALKVHVNRCRPSFFGRVSSTSSLPNPSSARRKIYAIGS